MTRLLSSVKGDNVMNPIILMYYKEWRRLYPLVPAKWVLYYAKHCSTGYMHPVSAVAFFGFATRAAKFKELISKREMG